MAANSPITRQSIGRTFIVAASILGVVALVQLSSVSWAFMKRVNNPRPMAQVDQGDGQSKPPSKIDVTQFGGPRPYYEDEPIATDSDPLSEGGQPEITDDGGLISVTNSDGRPRPVELSALIRKIDPRFNDLIEQGKLQRDSGDTASALTKFREAQSVEPTDARPVAETAYTFEKMGLPDKAAEQWRAILAMGEAAGVFYSAAEAKLRENQLATMRETSPPAPGAGPAAAIPEGKTLAIGNPEVTENSTGSSAQKFVLRVPIVAKSGEEISVRDAVTQVLFYDQFANKDIVKTTANVSYQWSTSPADWLEGGMEILEVEYTLPKTDTKDSRQYHGYVIRIYYKGELQDSRAEPPTLNQKFPAPYILSNDNNR